MGRVVTSTLTEFDGWQNSSGIGYADVAALREKLDLLSYGCGGLAHDLLADGLLDELHLNMTPVVAGRGRRLFGEPSSSLALDASTVTPTRLAPST